MALCTESLVTHFTGIWTLTPSCITGIFVFGTVYLKLFIHTALVKTQRLKISIYFDRRNNYYYSTVYIRGVAIKNPGCFYYSFPAKSMMERRVGH